jgi:hypothetical protein
MSSNKSDGLGAKALAIRKVSTISTLFFVVIALSTYFITEFNEGDV